MFSHLKSIGLVIGFAASTFAASPAKEWASFRGNDRSGVSQETGLLKSWPEDGPPVLWEISGAGRGYSSLSVSAGRVFTLGDESSIGDDKDEFLQAYDLASGKLLWRTKTGEPFKAVRNVNWEGSRSTPTVDGERVYVMTPLGVVVCCQSFSGKELWRVDLVSEFSGVKGDKWGYSESVLVDGDQVICTPGGDKNTMVALDKKTGKTIWTSTREGDRGAGHASAVVASIGGTRVIVQSTAQGAMGVRATDGKLLWTYDIDTTTAVIPTPIVRDDLVFFVAGYRRGGALLRQVSSGDNEVKVEEIYPLNTELANKHGGIVLVGDYLYGDSDDQGIPYCAELMTGKNIWKKRGSGKGSASVAAADGHLYFHFADGTMALVPVMPEPNGYNEVSTFKVPGSGIRPSWSHPVIVDGKLLVRENDTIVCYNVRG